MFRFRTGTIDSAASSKKAWKTSVSGVARLDGEEFPRPGTDGTHDVEADMVAVMNHFLSGSFDGPTSPGSRFSVDACFVPVPKLDIEILRKGLESIGELPPECFILSIRPRLRYLQDVTLLVKKTKDRIVGTLKRVFFGDMSMKGRSRPEGPLRTAGFFELFENLFLVLSRDQTSPSRPSLCNKSIGAVYVESLDNLPYGAFSQFDRLHHLLSGRAEKEHDDDETSTIRFPVAGLSDSLEIGEGRIFGIRHKVTLSHDPYGTTNLNKCLGITTLNGN